MSDVMYQQCGLSRKVEGGLETTVSWLPERFAHVGGYLKLLDERGTWENGWKVEDVCEGKLPEKVINKRAIFGSLENKHRSRPLGN